MAQAVKVIDVRTPMEFESGNVTGSVNIPLDAIPQHLSEIKATKEQIILCCASGGRSFSAYQFLKANGVNNVQDGGSWFQVAQAFS